MDFRTIIDIPRGGFSVEPKSRLLFVGSCFADRMGAFFREHYFQAVVNPHGVMYNPASVWHTVSRCTEPADIAVLTLGTNRVYILNETDEIVDNCQKRPQQLFTEKDLDIDECVMYLKSCVNHLCALNPDVKVILTVSPIRYRKYGYHGSQLSKATLLLAADRVVKAFHDVSAGGAAVCVEYFPSYEIVNDELRDYRFYAADMLHPSDQAVEYILERFAETYFSDSTRDFLHQVNPLVKFRRHKPFNPESPEYQSLAKRMQELEASIMR